MQFKKKIYHPIKNKLAKSYAKLLIKRGCTVIAVTGSAGKTTTKEMIASVLSQKFKTKWTHSNVDPVYNIPATILSTPPNTQKLILEMGIEYPGEMDFYLRFATPNVGVITNVYWTHTQFLKDIKNVAKEKGKLISNLPESGLAVLNADDSIVAKMAKKTKAKVIFYSTDSKADLVAKNVRVLKDYQTSFTLITKEGETDITLPLLGRHFVPLALASAAVGIISGLQILEIKKGLESVKPQPHRMIPLNKSGVLIIDDAYNANPLATIEALKALEEVGNNRRKIFMLGEMKELGDYERKGHEEVGTFAVKSGVDTIISIGGATMYTLSSANKAGLKKENTILVESKKELINLFKQIKKKGDVILIKGSRSMVMEEVVEAII